MNYTNILNVFDSVDLSIGEIQADTVEDENLNILNRIFINRNRAVLYVLTIKKC